MLYFQTLSKVTQCHFTGKRNWSQRTWPAQKKHPAGQEQTQPRPRSYFRSASQWSLVSWTSCKTAQHQHPHCCVLRSFFFYHLAKQQIHFFLKCKNALWSVRSSLLCSITAFGCSWEQDPEQRCCYRSPALPLELSPQCCCSWSNHDTMQKDFPYLSAMEEASRAAGAGQYQNKAKCTLLPWQPEQR